MKRWLIVGGVLLLVILTVVLMMKGVVVGAGYAIQGGGIVEVED